MPTASGDWRAAEYAKIGQLSGGLSHAHFNDVLGVPLFVTVSRDGTYTQYLYRGRDYWVQAVVNSEGSVALYAITSCDVEFRPPVRLPGGSDREIVLMEAHFADVGTPISLDYFVGGTSNSYFVDTYYGGNPSDYKTYHAGWTDACPPFVTEERAVANEILVRREDFDRTDVAVAAFRRQAIVNTYAEGGLPGDSEFQIGADRILTRTAPPYPED
jgi:hypothetical protein